MLEEFKKAKPPIFDGEMNILEDIEAWLIGMKKFFRLQEYSYNMEPKISTFSLKGKVHILWENVKNVKGIREVELI